jgi:pyrroline-5-carboxylate reductase
VEFNNERIVAECDLVFLCLLPFQANQVLKDVRGLTQQRSLLFADPNFGQQAKLKQTSAISLMKHHLSAHTSLQINGTDKIPPLFVSCLAATSIPKLRQMLCENSAWIKTQVNVPKIKSDLFKSR